MKRIFWRTLERLFVTLRRWVGRLHKWADEMAVIAWEKADNAKRKQPT